MGMMVEQQQATQDASIHLGERDDFVALRALDGMLMIDLVGAPDGEQIYIGMQEGYARGWITTSMPTLVDVSAFRGNINWAAIKAVSKLADWGRGSREPSRVAYVSSDPIFALVVKAASAMFPHSRHCMFPDRQMALDWLHSVRH